MPREPHAVIALPPVPRFVWAAYGLLGVALWPVPVLQVLHVESAAVVALVAFFVAGLAALRAFVAEAGIGPTLRHHLLALLWPASLLTVTLAWAPNKGYPLGALFFVGFAGVSVVLAVAVAYAITATRWRHKRRAFILLGVAVAVLTPLYDLGFHPQFYVYNHVFGGVLGPIYDEELALRPGLFWFRGLTLLWAALAYLLGRRLRGLGGRRRLVGVMGLIGLCYLGAGPLGINTPAWYLQRALGSVYHTAHFDLYYDASALPPDALARMAADHEYRYAQLSAYLDEDVPGRIVSYLYPDADAKARLTGARYTNVAPVWLRRPQTHVLQDAFQAVFGHELAHVFSRNFGLPVLRASLSVGLVEGLAAALSPPDGRPTAHEQVAAAAQQQARGRDHLGLATPLAERLSPLGFWTGRGAVSYTTMGSFVRFLLDAYGVEAFKAVYASGRFEAVYGQPVDTLTTAWEAALRRLPVIDRGAAPLARRRFSVPSLFERPSPHYVPPYRKAYRRGQQALSAGDTLAALSAFEGALARRPYYGVALDAWARVLLAQGDPEAVVARLDTLPQALLGPALALRLGDAKGLQGHAEAAQGHYRHALRGVPPYARATEAALHLRTLVAARPAVIRALTRSGTPAQQADRLSAWPDAAAVRTFRALRLAEGGTAEQAVALLRTTPPPSNGRLSWGAQDALARQRLAWLAEMSYQAQALEDAAAYAEAAQEAYRAVGDYNAAHAMADLTDKARWVSHSDLMLSPAME